MSKLLLHVNYISETRLQNFSLISFLNDKWIIYTKGKLELLSGNIRKADFTHINRKRFKLSKKGNEVIDYRGYRNGPTLAVISD